MSKCKVHYYKAYAARDVVSVCGNVGQSIDDVGDVLKWHEAKPEDRCKNCLRALGEQEGVVHKLTKGNWNVLCESKFHENDRRTWVDRKVTCPACLEKITESMSDEEIEKSLRQKGVDVDGIVDKCMKTVSQCKEKMGDNSCKPTVVDKFKCGGVDIEVKLKDPDQSLIDEQRAKGYCCFRAVKDTQEYTKDTQWELASKCDKNWVKIKHVGYFCEGYIYRKPMFQIEAEVRDMGLWRECEYCEYEPLSGSDTKCYECFDPIKYKGLPNWTKRSEPSRKLAKYQPCGCVICTCENPYQCQGCGATYCDTHPIAEIPNPVYEREPTSNPSELACCDCEYEGKLVGTNNYSLCVYCKDHELFEPKKEKQHTIPISPDVVIPDGWRAVDLTYPKNGVHEYALGHCGTPKKVTCDWAIYSIILEKIEPTTHKLKTLPEYFCEVVAGNKTFELRYNDRGFSAGDLLLLQEWDKENGYSGREITVKVSYILDKFNGVEDGFVIMGIQELQQLREKNK